MNALTMPSTLKVLIADDCATSRRIQEIVFRSPRYSVLTAGDGEEALRMVRAQRPDLLLLDLEMPRLGGLAVLRELKAESATRDLPVIVVSGCHDPVTQREVDRSGCDWFFTKPFDPGLLLSTVESLLSRVRSSLAPAPEVSPTAPTA